jgi:hypothetical protein
MISPCDTVARATADALLLAAREARDHAVLEARERHHAQPVGDPLGDLACSSSDVVRRSGNEMFSATVIASNSALFWNSMPKRRRNALQLELGDGVHVDALDQHAPPRAARAR